MSDDRFAKVHGPGYDPVNHLRTENNQLKGTIAALQQELVGRAMPTVGNLTDAINQFALMARQGNPGAQQALKNLLAALDAAKEAASSITIIRPNGQS